MAVDEGPTMRRRRLGAELKKAREDAGMTQEAVSRHFEWHAAKVTRIETARVAVTARDVRDLLLLYGVRDGDYLDSLVELARQSRERTWWTDYRDLMRPGNFVGMEAEASGCRIWEPIVLPGLFQTGDYMRALMLTGRPSDTTEKLERRISLRLTRQQRLSANPPLRVDAVIDESVVRRIVGGPDVMRAQLRRLTALNELPNVNIQILPFTAGEHLFMGGPATLLEFPDVAHSDVVYLEGLAGDYYEEQPLEVGRYRNELMRLASMALSKESSTAMIKQLIDE